jgi:copper homeostasis protein
MNYEPSTMNYLISLEVCANSLTSALAGQEGGAFRVELCENLKEGGTTPSPGQITIARKLLHIKLFVLIRPRSGDFLYDDNEFEIMKANVQYCVDAGCDGIVTGILNADGTIDKPRCAELVQLAKAGGLETTFHRAIDVCADVFRAMEDIIELGFDRILTSGGRSTAMEGASVIAHLVEKAAGRIIILPGSGIDEHNAGDLVHFTGVTEIHSSGKVKVGSKMTYKNDHIVMGDILDDEYNHDVTDVQRVRDILAVANKAYN